MRISRRRFCELFLSQTIASAVGACSVEEGFKPLLGFNLVSWDKETLDEPEAWVRAVKEVHATGADRVTLVRYMLIDMDHATLTESSAFGLAAGPSPSVLATAADAAMQLGMDVSIKPFIEIDDSAGEGERWRGQIDFSGQQLETFFESYRGYVLDLADVAHSLAASRFYLGSELAALTRNPEAQPYWQDLIASLRSRYHGAGRKLTYAANYDEYAHVPFWGLLDEIGIDAYFPLATAEQAEGEGRPSRAELAAAWQPIMARLGALSKEIGRPVFFSEWGAVPFDLTTVEPSEWRPSDMPDLMEALDAYHATLEAANAAGSWLAGIDFWHWAVEEADDSNYRITPGSDIAAVVKSFTAGQ